jgi:hypothetical protein
MQLIVVILSRDSLEVVERWDFDIEKTPIEEEQ